MSKRRTKMTETMENPKIQINLFPTFIWIFTYFWWNKIWYHFPAIRLNFFFEISLVRYHQKKPKITKKKNFTWRTTAVTSMLSNFARCTNWNSLSTPIPPFPKIQERCPTFDTIPYIWGFLVKFSNF